MVAASWARLGGALTQKHKVVLQCRIPWRAAKAVPEPRPTNLGPSELFRTAAPRAEALCPLLSRSIFTFFERKAGTSPYYLVKDHYYASSSVAFP
jgi:hypothetical protein